MDVLVLQVFCSFVLVSSSLVLFAISMKHREHEHHRRLALLPLENESKSHSRRNVDPKEHS